MYKLTTPFSVLFSFYRTEIKNAIKFVTVGHKMKFLIKRTFILKITHS